MPLAAYNDAELNERPFRERFPDENVELDEVEAKFQISVKFPLVYGLIRDKADLFFAHTNGSFWHVYNSDISAPFPSVANSDLRRATIENFILNNV